MPPPLLYHLTPTHQSPFFSTQQLRGHPTPPVSAADQVSLNICLRFYYVIAENTLGYRWITTVQPQHIVVPPSREEAVRQTGCPITRHWMWLLCCAPAVFPEELLMFLALLDRWDFKFKILRVHFEKFQSKCFGSFSIEKPTKDFFLAMMKPGSNFLLVNKKKFLYTPTAFWNNLF